MRLIALIVSALFTAEGVWMIASGNSFRWGVAGFFSLCLLIAILKSCFTRPQASCEHRILITQDEAACEHPKGLRESTRWDDVVRIWYVTTADGPWRPDQWILLEGEHGGCSLPTDAVGFDGIWDEFKQRFAGFEYGPLIRGGTDEAKYLCWERLRPTKDITTDVNTRAP